jgi:hypothetical protein
MGLFFRIFFGGTGVKAGYRGNQTAGKGSTGRPETESAVRGNAGHGID